MAIASTIIGAGIAAAGAIGASKIASSASKKASATAADANTQNLALQRETYEQNKAALAPWQQSGLQANGILTGALGFGSPEQATSAFNAYKGSAGYDFRVNEGMRALNSGWAGAGVLQSGAAMKGAMSYGQNIASAEYNNWLSQVTGQAQQGFAAASAQAGIGQNFANNSSALNASNAATQAQLQLQRGQNTASMVGALGQIGGYVAGSVFAPKPAPTTPPYNPGPTMGFGAIMPSTSNYGRGW